MDNMSDQCRRTNLIWGVFLLLLALGWILNLTGLVQTSIWQLAGPLGLVFGGITLLLMRR